MEEKEILIDDLKINYKIAGEGPAILILHGWGSCAKNWYRVQKLLEKEGIKVFVPDLPGFGDNPLPAKSWSIDDYVHWLRNYCEKQNLSQIFLLGHSFGGSLAVKFVLKYPEKIKKLFLVAPAIIRRKTLKKEIIKKTAKIFPFLPGFIKKIIYRKIIKSDYPLEAGTMRETYLKIIGENIFPHLSGIKVPTMIIWGQNDRVTPLFDAYLIKKEIPNSEIKIIEKAGHRINSEVPEKLVETILGDSHPRNFSKLCQK